VAIYDEPNTTLPEYATGFGMQFSNEISALITLLEGAGYTVTTLDVHNILNHELKTADYDVLILADNYPRENITNYVDEFYLGGGGVLGFNAAFGYLLYSGMIMPEAKGDDVYGFLWDEETWSTHKIVQRHPITKSLQVDDTIVEPTHDAKEFFNGPYIKENSTVGPYFEIVANQSDGMGYSSIVCLDNVIKGGRVVGMAANTSTISSAMGNIIIDAVEWLCPRPKGKILFDVSHRNFYPVDIWDPTQYTGAPRFSSFRETLVNKSYTFDKLWPSAAGNLTAANLAPYDLLVLNIPEYNFTLSEIAAVSDWVSAGGGLFLMGESGTFLEENQNINYLLENYDLWMNLTENFNPWIFTTTTFAEHPTVENINELYFFGGCYVNYTGDAYPLVMQGANTVVASQEVGNGRIMLAGDINYLSNAIDESDNVAYAVNVANWLVSWDAEVLVHQSYHSSHLPAGGTEYRTAMSRALNELGMDFMLHTDSSYLNQSLHLKSWDLVIIDASYYSLKPYYNDIQNYLETGGKLIMRDFYFYVQAESSVHDLGLFSYLGFEGTGSRITGGPPAIYPWESGHPIFNQPIEYDANNISSDNNNFLTDFANVTLFDNATAIAGITPNPQENQSAIVLSVDGRALCNMFAIGAYTDDTDDSTYADNYELWLNEIAFMVRPTIDSPSDMSIEAFDTGESITWTPLSDRPHSYKIERNSVEVESGSWDGGEITYDLEEHSLELIEFELTVYDNTGSSASDAVMVTVVDTTDPALVDAPGNLQYEEGKAEHLVNWSFTENLPDSYVFYINGTVEASGDWNGSEISVDAGGLSAGAWNLTLAVNDTSGNLVTSTVYLNVTEAATTTTTTTTTTETTTTTTGETTTTTPAPGGIDTTLILIAAVVGAIVLIVIILWMRKR